ncbi:ImmA/IrrE family metallo-endopeptidase [Sandaracinus amylolyticus]|uniref:ImmA/IrrE family metallo-endopeptidase n=1 Tax=Sandaracinus amylolyticus TaxID=927083 RepID=UPI001F25BDA9|nr:ImmA/IrrE family metallo-endopeptidase [Sandaracinus amylolyticus]UJR81453.1 Hypothetical protein I5071_35120 [Sandaracinus amylolyticus]
MERQLEDIATATLAKYGMPLPVDIYRLCIRMKYDVRLGEPGSRPTVLGRTIFVTPEEPEERQRFAAAHELAHMIMRALGLSISESEKHANWLASALLHPEAWFLERLAARGWDLAALKTDCRWSSYEAIGRRIVSLQPAVLWVCDRGPGVRKGYRVASRGLVARHKKPTRIEWKLVRDAAASLQPQVIAGVGAWPLPSPEHEWLRVVSLARADAIAM